MRRLAGLIFIVSLVGGALAPALATAAPPAAPSYDLARVREAMRAGAEAVGAPPAEAAAYFADRPLQWFHPTQDAVTQTQPDGSTFEARILEIEDGGGQATTTGRLITRADDGWWYYGIRAANGRIEATGARVGIDPAPDRTRTSDMPAEFKANLAQHEAYAAELNEYLHARFAAQAAAAAAAGEPVVFKVPALMLEINNEPFLEGSTPDTVEARYSGTGTSPTGTVTEMYLEQSFGNLVVQVDVYGIYTSAVSMNPVNDCWYGTDGGPILGDTLGLGGYGAKGLAAEAVPQADPEVDFSEYDMDGDNYVDFLMIVHSGRGAETTGDPCDVHSHRFGGLAPALVDGAPSEPTPMTADGVAIGQALTVPEIDAGIGVVAHELMHAFGEPDYYGTAGTSGTGDWDLGGGGSYGGVPTQSSPLHFNPLMKINFGWVEPRRIDATTLDVELRPRASHPDLLLVPVREVGPGDPAHLACDNDPINSGRNQVANFVDDDGDCLVEGYLIEFLSPTSATWDHDSCTFTPADFDRQMYGTGLAVWHYDLTNYKQLGNNERLRPMLDLEEFDRRDGAQEMEQNLSRAEPIDLFWGDPVGISSATAAGAVSEIDIPAPGGSPYVVTATPGMATTTDPWVAPTGAPTGAQMTVTLSWPTEDTDDWDLAVFKNVDGEWIEVDSDGAPPGEGPESVTVPFTGGAEYRAEAVNYASVSMTAEVSVEYAYNSEIATKFGPANTLSADFEATGWSFTNIRPFDYRGFAHSAQAADATMTLDLVKHDATTVDVSGDFLQAVTGDGFAEPVKAGQPVTLRSAVYNHGGKAVTGATFRVYEADPASGATPIAEFVRDLDGFGRDAIEFEVTPKAGRNEFYVVASAAGDLVRGNDVVRTEIVANPAGAASVLIVDNDRGWTQEQTIEAALLGLGVAHDVVVGEPDADTLAAYDAAIWLTTGVSGPAGVLSPLGWDAITTYLDQGGNVWLASNRAGGYAGDPAVGRGTKLAQYFGVAAVNNILDPLRDYMHGQGDPIGGDREILMSYIDGRPYLDYYELASDVEEPPAEPIGDVVGLFVHDQRPDHYVGARVEAPEFKSVITGSPTGIARAEDQFALVAEVMDWFGIATPGPDRTDTRVAFNRFQHVQNGDSWHVAVGAPSADLVEFVYRIHGDDTWVPLGLQEVAPGYFGGAIPGSDVTNNGLDYYVRVVEDGVVRELDGGAAMPNVASGTYGDAANVDFGVCAAQTSAPTSPAPAPADTGDSAPLPTTGGGLALIALAALGGAAGLHSRRRNG